MAGLTRSERPNPLLVIEDRDHYWLTRKIRIFSGFGIGSAGYLGTLVGIILNAFATYPEPSTGRAYAETGDCQRVRYLVVNRR
jgi:hypothetical protein